MVVLVVTFCIIFYGCYSTTTSVSIRELFLETILYFTLAVCCITELSSLYVGISYYCLLLGWLILAIISIGLIFLKRKKVRTILSLLLKLANFYIPKSEYKILILLVTVFFLQACPVFFIHQIITIR